MKSRCLVAMMVVLSSGCASISEKCCPPAPAPIGFVTTGGRYCVAQSIPVPDEGLTLGRVVSMSLRPNLSLPERSPLVQRKRNGTGQLPLGLKVVQLNFAEEAWKGFSTLNDLEDAAEIVQKTDEVAELFKNAFRNQPSPPENPPNTMESLKILSQDDWKVIEPQIRECCKRALDRGILPAGEKLDDEVNTMAPEDRAKARSQQATALSQFKEEIIASVIFGLLWQPGGERQPEDVAKVERLLRVTLFPTPNSPSDEDLSRKTGLEVLIHNSLATALATGTLNLDDDSTHFENATKLLFDIQQRGAAQQQQQPASPTGSNDLNIQEILAPIEEQLIVTLFQSGGRLISTPLCMVTDYSAGDIVLSTNDHVEVTAFSQTSVGSPLVPQEDGNVLALGPMLEPEISTVQSLTAMPSSFEEFVQTKGSGMADVVVIRRIELSGQLHDFLLPIPRPELYENSAAAADMLSQVKLQTGDQVHLEVLDLTPMIRESRRMSQLASQAAAEEAAFYQTESRQSWVAKKFQKHHAKKRMVCAHISSQTELVTGINPSDLAKITGECQDNLAVQVGMAP